MFIGMLIPISSILLNFRSVVGNFPLLLLVVRMLGASVCWWKPSCISKLIGNSLDDLYYIILILYHRHLDALGGLQVFDDSFVMILVDVACVLLGGKT